MSTTLENLKCRYQKQDCILFLVDTSAAISVITDVYEQPESVIHQSATSRSIKKGDKKRVCYMQVNIRTIRKSYFD